MDAAKTSQKSEQQ